MIACCVLVHTNFMCVGVLKIEAHQQHTVDQYSGKGDALSFEHPIASPGKSAWPTLTTVLFSLVCVGRWLCREAPDAPGRRFALLLGQTCRPYPRSLSLYSLNDRFVCATVAGYAWLAVVGTCSSRCPSWGTSCSPAAPSP